MNGGLRYVYAICGALPDASRNEVTGIAGAPLAVIRHDGLTAVASTVAERDFAEEPLRARLEDLDFLSATARAHHRVIDALTNVTSPLPLRLGTVFRDDDAVRAMLRDREEEFLRALDRLDGRVEWGVKIYAGPAAPEEQATEAEGPRDTGGATTGRDYLRRRRTLHRAREATWDRAEEFAGRLHHSLAEYAEDDRIHRPQSATLSRAAGRNILNAAYLVPRSRSEEFVALVDGAKGEVTDLRVELTGPWAAYSFSEPSHRTQNEEGT
ncbi:GvpL/GvpF family gas vesicle protein [Streptomyces sp. NPDC046821]|uniref:GvpL/GvpF family gas vesicle protein n=1 Tax=Streptomyces sp. NPDC046821 TaxID=3154702 RepID=UPI0033C6ADAC